MITQLADSGSTFGAGDADAMVTAVDVCTMDAVKELPFMAFARIDFNMPGCFKIVPIGEVIWLPMVENIASTGVVKCASNGWFSILVISSDNCPSAVCFGGKDE